MNNYDCSALKGKIVEKFGTRRNFAKHIGWSDAVLSAKLCGKTDFSRSDMELVMNALNEPISMCNIYFFSKRSQDLFTN